MSAKNLLLKLGVTATDHKVDVYRDGDVVTVVAKGNATRHNGEGTVRTSGIMMQQYDSVSAFEKDKQQLFDRFPLAYTKIIHKLGISDDVSKAKPLPENMRHLLPEYSKALPQNSEVQISIQGEVSTEDSVETTVKAPWYQTLVDED